MRVAEPFLVMAKPVGPVCNLDCAYCYYLEKRALFPRGERFRMSPEVLEAYVARYIGASPGPLVHFVWHGGEPTLAGLDFYRLAVELQGRYLPEGWQCLNSLQTNGTRLDDEWGTFLAEHGFFVGLSIDGPAHLHDEGRRDRRGRSSHDRAVRGLRVLRAHGIDPDVLCALHARNVRHPLETYRFFLELGVTWLQFLPVVRRDERGRLDSWSVVPEAMGEFLCTVFDEWVRHDVGRIGVQNFLEPFLVVSGTPANLCVMAETCGRALALEHDGSVYSCDHFVEPAHRLGTVVVDDLGALVESLDQSAFATAKRDDLPGACRSCPVLAMCNGGCPKDRFAIAPGGDPGLNYLCVGYRRFYEHARPHLARMRSLAVRGRPVADIVGELEVAERDLRRRWQMTPRNASCPCGSGKKYKQCCLPRQRR
jgi:uncharacterized protein